MARSAPLARDDRDRLRAAGLDKALLGSLDLVLAEADTPDWWASSGNRLYLTRESAPDARFFLTHAGAAPAVDALVVLAERADVMPATLMWGSGGLLFIGPGSSLRHGSVALGGASTIVLEGEATAIRSFELQARNGGSIVAGHDQLWATGITLQTDDMHAIRDASSGQRLNGFGGHIRIGRHVWLGRDSVVLGGAVVGRDTVVGLGSIVTAGEHPDGVVLAGAPVRVVRTGITWSRDDLP